VFRAHRDDNRRVHAATRILRGFSATLVATLVLIAPASAAPAVHLPPGYFIDSDQLAAERPADRVEADGDFTLAIHRKYENALGAHLLDIAEALYPPREVIINRAIENVSEIGSDSARTSLWWQEGVGV